MARMGNVEPGLARMKRALAMQERRAAAAPNSGSEQRSVATSSALIGDVLVLRERHAEAARYFRAALTVTEQLVAADPHNEQYRRDLSNCLARLGDALARSGSMQEGRALTRRALAVLRPLMDKEGSSLVDLYQYAWILLTTPVIDLRDPVTARRYAGRLVEATQGEDPRNLDLLALAHAGAKDYDRAIEIETRALSLLPADARSDLRSELTRNLAAFRSAATALRAR
jgi:tetratricopeptide (TPR) repeat protein